MKLFKILLVCSSIWILFFTLMIIDPENCFSATLEVGSGKAYSTVQAGVNAARNGDTVLVYDGTYQEDVDVNTSNITIQSVKEWGAVMDGNSGSLTYAFDIDSDRVKIIGFMIQNYNVAAVNKGLIHLHSNGDNGEIKYCKFENNTLDTSNSACIFTYNATNLVVRGNYFTGNVWGGADAACVQTVYASSSVLELNKVLDTGHYQFYLTNGSNNSTIQYNYFNGSYSRYRQSSGLTYQHNYVNGSAVMFHDQCPEDYSSENHTITRNTIRNSGSGILLVQQDDDDITYNLFINNSSAIVDLWESTCTTSGINSDHDHFENVTNQTEDLDGGEYTQTNTTTGASGFNATTGCNTLSSPDRGSDVKIDVWPFTTCSGGALQSDYPYSEYVPDPLSDIPPHSPVSLKIVSNDN